MRLISIWPAVLGLALAMALVNIIEPIEHSLSFAGGVLVIISLIGWVLEAREVAGPPPEVEPEHEEEEEAPGPSYWPVVLAVGVVAIATGLVYDEKYLGLVISLPLAAAAAAAWGKAVQEEQSGVTVQHPWHVPAVPAPAPAAEAGAAAGGGGFLMPVPQRVLAAQAAGGAAIAIERVERREVSRRGLLRITFWAGLGAGLAAVATSFIDFMYPRGVVGFGGIVNPPGTVDQYPPGTKTPVQEGKFWLVSLTAEQGGPGFLALWWKCPHLGCTVPWREEFTFNDKRGWFRCPCHGSTYDDAGVRVYGPAPRPMDRMLLTIDPNSKRISVNTGRVTKGTPDNAKFAVKAPS